MFFPPQTTSLDHVFVCITQVESSLMNVKTKFPLYVTELVTLILGPPGNSLYFLGNSIRSCLVEKNMFFGVRCPLHRFWLRCFHKLQVSGNSVHSENVGNGSVTCWRMLEFFPFLFQREHNSILLFSLFDNRLVISINYGTPLCMLWGCFITFG